MTGPVVSPRIEQGVLRSHQRSLYLITDANERTAKLAGLHALELLKGEHVLELGFGTGSEIMDIATSLARQGGTGY